MPIDLNSGIYQIRNVNNDKVYVGSAVCFKERENEHFRKLRYGTHQNCHLQRSYNKHGKESFVFEVLEYVQDENMLIGREQVFIDAAMSTGKFYNLSPTAGSTLGYRYSDESKTKMRASRLGRFTGTDNHRAKKIYEFDLALNFVREWSTAKECADTFGLSRGNIAATMKKNSVKLKNRFYQVKGKIFFPTMEVPS